jgi:hypothetical protein
MALWRFPVPQLLSDDIVGFQFAHSLVGASVQLNPRAFYEREAKENARRAVKTFCGALLDAIAEIKGQMDSLEINVTSLLTAEVLDVDSALDAASEIDTKFIE